MRQGITTKYHGPTNSRGSRHTATARKASSGLPAQKLTTPQDYALGVEENHTRAAKALAEKLGWSGLWVGGGNVSEDGYHYVNIDTDSAQTHLLTMTYGAALGVEGRDWFRVEEGH